MTQQALTELNVGQNLDDLMNLDPRGYGVCRILYTAARARAGEPLSIHLAKKLRETAKPGDLVFILTGFILLPHKQPEMDGIVGAVLLARALVHGLDVKPVLIVPPSCIDAVRQLAAVVGLHVYDSIAMIRELPASMAIYAFPIGSSQAEATAETLIAEGLPSLVIATEAPGANAFGRYHTSMGLDVTDLEAHSDILYRKLQAKGIPALAVGDLGNEIGMGAISGHLERFIPRASNIAANTVADALLTATVSDWGVNAIIAALAFLLEDPDVLHTPETQREAMLIASRAGMVDMSGWLVPNIDGFDLEMNQMLVGLMRRCIEYPLKLRKSCAHWFDAVLERGFYA